MGKRRIERIKKIVMQVPVTVVDDFTLPPQFERYVTLKAASDLLALEAQKIWWNMFDKPQATTGGKGGG